MKEKDIDISKIRFLIGISLILFSLICLVNVGYISQSLVIVFTFFFGYYGYFLILPLIMFAGVMLIINREKKLTIKFNFFFFSIILFFLSLLVYSSIWIYYLTDDNELFLSTFNSLYIKIFSNAGATQIKAIPYMHINVFDYKIGGGYIGYFFGGCLNSLLSPLTAIISTSVLLLISISFLVIHFVLKHKEKKANVNETKTNDETSNQKIIDIEFKGEYKNKDSKIEKQEVINPVIENKEPEINKPIATNNVIEKTDNQNSVDKDSNAPEFFKNYKLNPTIEVPKNNPDLSKNNYQNTPITKNENHEIIEPKYENILEKKPEPKIEVKPIIEPKSIVNQPINNQEIKKPVEEHRDIDPYKKKKKFFGVYKKPGLDLLDDTKSENVEEENKVYMEKYKSLINNTFDKLKIDASIETYTIGPRVTQFDIQVGENSSVSILPKYMQDISQRLGGVATRFEAIVPGKMTSGLEVPNVKSSPISFKEIYTAMPENDSHGKKSRLLIPFGKNLSGKIIYSSLTSFPHFLIAGSTGSGKSVFVHSIILSFLLNNTPEELKLLLIDPKRVEFSRYKGIPFLLCPPVTDPVQAHAALQKLVAEMNRRYALFEQTPYAKIDNYNKYAKEHGLETIPYIVGIVDEFADLINTNKKVEFEINLLAAKSRACGIHLIIATQRPSVDVITGTIKNNLPVRVALRVSDMESSKTILGKMGAESLLGNGDMLVLCPDVQSNGNARVQGCYVSDEEIIRVVENIKKQRGEEYDENFMNLTLLQETDSNSNRGQINGDLNDDNELIRQIKLQLINKDYISLSALVRMFSIGYTRAGKICQKLQNLGVISSESESTKGYKVFKENINDVSLSGSDELTTIKRD